MQEFTDWISVNYHSPSAKFDIQTFICEHQYAAMYYWNGDTLSGIVFTCPACMQQLMCRFSIVLQIILRPKGYWSQHRPTNDHDLSDRVDTVSKMLANDAKKMPFVAHIGRLFLCADIGSLMAESYALCCLQDYLIVQNSSRIAPLGVPTPDAEVRRYQTTHRIPANAPLLYTMVARCVTKLSIWTPENGESTYPCLHGFPNMVTFYHGVIETFASACPFCLESILVDSRFIHAKFLGNTKVIKGDAVISHRAADTDIFARIPQSILSQQAAFINIKKLTKCLPAVCADHIHNIYGLLCFEEADVAARQYLGLVCNDVQHIHFDFSGMGAVRLI